MNVRWGTVEFGAPEVDGKRPYGNSDVPDDIREIVGMQDAKYEWCVRVHREMEAVLQVHLSSLGISPGDQLVYKGYQWKKLSEIEVDV